jgi:hypothetical protein
MMSRELSRVLPSRPLDLRGRLAERLSVGAIRHPGLPLLAGEGTGPSTRRDGRQC